MTDVLQTALEVGGIALLAFMWLVSIVLIVLEVREWLADRRLLRAMERRQALDLTEPRGRPRLGLPTDKEEK